MQYAMICDIAHLSTGWRAFKQPPRAWLSKRSRLGFQKLTANSKDLVQDACTIQNSILKRLISDNYMHIAQKIDAWQWWHCVLLMTGMDVLDMLQERDGKQDVKLFERKVETALRNLPADEQLAGCQHHYLKDYKHASRERILRSHTIG